MSNHSCLVFFSPSIPLWAVLGPVSSFLTNEETKQYQRSSVSLVLWGGWGQGRERESGREGTLCGNRERERERGNYVGREREREREGVNYMWKERERERGSIWEQTLWTSAPSLFHSTHLCTLLPLPLTSLTSSYPPSSFILSFPLLSPPLLLSPSSSLLCLNVRTGQSRSFPLFFLILLYFPPSHPCLKLKAQQSCLWFFFLTNDTSKHSDCLFNCKATEEIGWGLVLLE